VPVVSLTTIVMLCAAAPVSAHGSGSPGAAEEEDFEGVLQSVSAVSASDVWAVGFHDDEDEGNSTLIEHWDGTEWSLVDGPEVEESSLYGVSALSKANAWAVGFALDGSEYDTLIEHWDGSSWTEVPSPSPGGGSGSFLKSVSALTANDVWAVGYTQDAPLIEHWDGTEWTVVHGPGGPGFQLNGVQALAKDDAIAVGNTAGAGSRTFVVRWNGTKWSRMDSVGLDKTDRANRLDGVSASSATDVWAVGAAIRYPRGTARPLIEHWDGSSWERVPGVEPERQPGTRLTGVSAVSPQNVWAVGFSGLDKSGSYRAFIEHWNGHRWRCTETERPEGSRGDSVVGVDAIDRSHAWAAGAYTNLEESLTNSMTQNWDGQEWTEG